MNGDAHVSDLAAGYALGALTAHERELVDAHIAECDDCRGDVMAMLGISGTLPLACEQIAPPAILKGRILAAAAADVRAGEALARRSSGDTSGSWPQRSPGASARWRTGIPAGWGWFAAAAAAAAIVFGATSIDQAQQRNALQRQVDTLALQLEQARHDNVALQDEAQSGHAVMTALASGTYWTMGPHADANGKMWRFALLQPPARGHNGMLLAMVPEPPRGMAYQVWITRKGTPHKAGMVMHGGMTMMDMAMPLQKGDIVAFSVEPMTGSKAPTSPYMMEMAI
jgi:anti-sigma-K factor RskA